MSQLDYSTSRVMLKAESPVDVDGAWKSETGGRAS